MFKNALLASATAAVVAAGGWSAVAVAQDEAAQGQDDSDVIVVTAQRRTERLLDVPLAVSVLGAETMEQTGIRELTGAAEYLPNVEVSQWSDFNSAVTIRGVGANSRNIGFDTRVGVYVDGVYMGQSPSVNQELLDLERVEVLRGPQGTLFGKNTVAGAINLVTKKPEHELTGRFSVDVGNMGYTEFKGVVNVPLGEWAAGKLSVSKVDRDGYVLNETTGNDLGDRDVFAARGQITMNPNSALEINLSADYLTADNHHILGEPVTDMLGLFPTPVAQDVGVVAFSFDTSEERDVYGAAADVSYAFENGFTIKSITGYRDTDANYHNDTDYHPQDVISVFYEDAFEQLSQEFQLVSPENERFGYIAGVYLYAQDATTTRDAILGEDLHEAFVAPVVAPAAGPLVVGHGAPYTAEELAIISAAVGFGPEGSFVRNTGEVETRSYAAYVNGSFDITERLTAGFGLRYSSEDKDVDWLLDGSNSGVFGIGSTGADPLNQNPAIPATPLVNSRTDEHVSPSANLTYALSDRSNVYARYSSGYKSGGFNLDYINGPELAANQGLEFDKETVDAYEIGYKGSLADGRLQLNLAAFLSQYQDYQVNQFVDLGEGGTAIRITNAAEVETSGLEAEATFQATDNLLLTGSIGTLDASFKSFPGGGAGGSDATGNKLPNAPELSLSTGVQYFQPVDSLNANLLFRVDLNYRYGFYTTSDQVKQQSYSLAPGTFPFGYVEELTLVNARIGFLPNNERFEVYLWGRNLTDEQQITSDIRDFFNTYTSRYQVGRTYGIEAAWNF